MSTQQRYVNPSAGPADTENVGDVSEVCCVAEAVTAPPIAVLTEAGELLRALSAPLRIAIVLQLQAGPRCVHELVDALDATQPLISQHLRILKSTRVVNSARSGREVVYSLRDSHLAEIVDAAVSHVQEIEP